MQPLLNPLLKAWTGQVLEPVFNLVQPFYAPHRKAVLQAETKLAAVVAPHSRAPRVASAALRA